MRECAISSFDRGWLSGHERHDVTGADRQRMPGWFIRPVRSFDLGGRILVGGPVSVDPISKLSHWTMSISDPPVRRSHNRPPWPA